MINLKFAICSLLLLLLGSGIQAQTLSNRVVATGGSYSTATWGSLSATVGEPAITTFSASNILLLQGFQQPTSGLAGIDDTRTTQAAYVYPNPANDAMILEVNLPVNSNVGYKVFDISGKELYSGTFSADALHTTSTRIDVSNWSNGMYLISLYSENGKLQNTKIQVIH